MGYKTKFRIVYLLTFLIVIAYFLFHPSYIEVESKKKKARFGTTNNDLTITNMDSTRIMNPNRRWYNFRANVSEGNYTLSSVSIAFSDGVTFASFTWESTGFFRISGYEIAELNASSSNNATSGSGYGAITIINFQIMIKHGIDNSYNRTLYMRSIDSNKNSTGWETMQTDYVDLVKTYNDVAEAKPSWILILLIGVPIVVLALVLSKR